MPEFTSRYQIGEALGQGAFGKVHKVVRKEDKVALAAKVVEIKPDEDIKRRTLVYREQSLWQSLGANRNVVMLMDAFACHRGRVFVMELCDTTLHEALPRGLLGRDLAAICSMVTLDVCNALRHLHGLGIVHRDVKPTNLLVAGTTIKLADFGLAVLVPPEGIKGMTGSLPFMAPEVLKGESYCYKVDVWSLGIVLYALVFGEPPFDKYAKTRKTMLAAQDAPLTFQRPDDRSTPAHCRRIVSSALTMHKAARPTADALHALVAACQGNSQPSPQKTSTPLMLDGPLGVEPSPPSKPLVEPSMADVKESTQPPDSSSDGSPPGSDEQPTPVPSISVPVPAGRKPKVGRLLGSCLVKVA